MAIGKGKSASHCCFHVNMIFFFFLRFRIPRPAVVDQGTRAIMEFLGRRIAA
jgi:hypothetical protein